MVEVERVAPPHDGGEKELLLAHLNYHRLTLVEKLRGVSEADARRSFVPSPTTLLGLVTHCIDVERWWFGEFVAGRPQAYRSSDEDPDGDFRPRPGETVESVLEEYLAECARSDEVIAAADLDTVVTRGRRSRSVRWVLLHMLAEMARHDGHADILRELVDGTTGD